MPITFVTFGLGYLAIIGIPPFSGFFTKDTIIDAAFDKGGTSGAILGLGRADRGRHHRVLHDPGDVHDLRRRAPLGARSPPARGAAGDDLADDRARDRLGRRSARFLILNNRLLDFLGPVTGSEPPDADGVFTTPGPWPRWCWC